MTTAVKPKMDMKLLLIPAALVGVYFLTQKKGAKKNG
jgi:hypothetical protein